MTNVEKYVRSHDTGELVRVDQTQAEAMWVTGDKADTLDALFTLSSKVSNGGELKFDESTIDKKYLPIVDAILVRAKIQRSSGIIGSNKAEADHSAHSLFSVIFSHPEFRAKHKNSNSRVVEIHEATRVGDDERTFFICPVK